MMPDDDFNGFSSAELAAALRKLADALTGKTAARFAFPDEVWVWFDGLGNIICAHTDRKQGMIAAEHVSGDETPRPIRGHLYARDKG